MLWEWGRTSFKMNWKEWEKPLEIDNTNANSIWESNRHGNVKKLNEYTETRMHLNEFSVAINRLAWKTLCWRDQRPDQI